MIVLGNESSVPHQEPGTRKGTTLEYSVLMARTSNTWPRICLCAIRISGLAIADTTKQLTAHISPNFVTGESNTLMARHRRVLSLLFTIC